MKVGTKSLLFGVHQFILHPLFTAAGWIGCYGFSAKGYSWWKLVECFVIHDWGYWGLDNMDGEKGELHPYKAAWKVSKRWSHTDYFYLCLYHSRFLAEKHGKKPSFLCWADKLGTAYMPTWLWVFLARLSGEVDEYMSAPKHIQVIGRKKDPYKYFEAYKKHIRETLKEVL